MLRYLRKRGFPTKTTAFEYQWYYWLRLKELAEKEDSLQEMLEKEELFSSDLMMAHPYYRMQPKCREQECVDKMNRLHVQHFMTYILLRLYQIRICRNIGLTNIN